MNVTTQFSVHNNILAMNADRMLGINDNARLKSTEKLSSGYKINRAADDAAGLAISEKMRRLIRGLAQGTQNAQDGVAWVQIADGALHEGHDILQRMNELSIKSLNGTNSDSDRAFINDEFAQLLKEIDRIGVTAEFNAMDIFSKHKEQYYTTMGNVKWDPKQLHVVTEGKNDLTITYCLGDRNSPQDITFTVPPGIYSTEELIDVLDSSIAEKMDGFDTWFELELDKEGHVNVSLEGGTFINKVTGGLSYLLYEMYQGGGTGALLGTTIFPTDSAKLTIIEGRNDDMTFTVQDLKGNSYDEHITIPEGEWTRDELIDKINAALTAPGAHETTVRATPYGNCIKLGSPSEFVTGFKGNMFKIDGAEASSVFYDNVKYGDITQGHAVFTGGGGAGKQLQ